MFYANDRPTALNELLEFNFGAISDKMVDVVVDDERRRDLPVRYGTVQSNACVADDENEMRRRLGVNEPMQVAGGAQSNARQFWYL